MRYVFGLAGLLITIGVIVMILHFAVLPYNKAVLDKGRDARDEAEQLAGEKNGMRTGESIKIEPQNNGEGKPVSLLVTSIVAGGPMESYFGLKRYDTITEINGLRVKDQNDGELSVAMALEAYQRKQTLTVVRDGQTLTLPAQPVATPVGAKPAKSTDGLQGQLDAIQQNVGTR